MLNLTEEERREHEFIARRIETGDMQESDYHAVMRLLGYDVFPHKRTRFACRKVGESGHLQSLPYFSSAHDAALWITPERTGGRFDEIEQDKDGTWAASFLSSVHGNDYGYSSYLGRAMFAGFVRSQGQSMNEDEDESEAA